MTHTVHLHRVLRAPPERIFRAFPDAKPVFQDFLVRAVEARVDEPVRTARSLAGHAFEMPFSGGGVFKDKGGGEKDRRL